MALSAATVWEVRSTGSDTLNSGGFVAGASGTDYSQQAAAQYSAADLAGTSANTATPSVTSATHSFVAADVGNILVVKSGTNWTAGFYQIVSVAGGAATLDRACASVASPTSGSYAVGGAFATPGQAGVPMVGGNTVYIKNGGATAYTQSSASANVAGGYLDPPLGTAAAPSQVIGYNATRGDLDSINDFSNFPTIKSFAGGASTVIRATNNFVHLRNLAIDCNSQANYGVYVPGDNNQIVNCKVINQTGTTQGSFYAGGNKVVFWRCLASAGGIGFHPAGSTAWLFGCVATGCTSLGFFIDIGVHASLVRCIAYGNSGASTDGFSFQSSTTAIQLIGCVAHNNGRDGLRFTAALGQAAIFDSIFTSNGGYGINSTTTNAAVWDVADYNAFRSNTSGDRFQFPAGAHDVSLTGDPFTNAASGDFSLNNTAGAGAACRAAGYPGVFPGGTTTGYLDIGAAQHQDTGGTSGLVGAIVGARSIGTY